MSFRVFAVLEIPKTCEVATQMGGLPVNEEEVENVVLGWVEAA